MKFVGHRGESLAAPENSLESFTLAWMRGVKCVEGDFHLTKDEAITCTLPVEGAEEFQVFLKFDDFRTLTKYSRNKSVVIGYEDGRLTVDRMPLSTVNVKWPDVARLAEAERGSSRFHSE